MSLKNLKYIPEYSSGSASGSQNSLETLLSNSVEGSKNELHVLIREHIQNSLDAYEERKNKPEKLIFNVTRKQIDSSQFKLNELKKIFEECYKYKKTQAGENYKTVRSINKNIRSSVRKLNPILKAIVGKKVDVAIRDLQFSEKRITKDIRKTISSAVANAENNFQYDIDKLIVKEAYCGKKITMKRFRPRAKGRAAPILKPYSSVTIILSETKKMESHGTKS